MAIKVGSDYRIQLIEQVRAVGAEIIERAEDLVGGGNLISDFYIDCNFPQGGGVPTITVTREHVSKKALNVVMKEDNLHEI